MIHLRGSLAPPCNMPVLWPSIRFSCIFQTTESVAGAMGNSKANALTTGIVCHSNVLHNLKLELRIVKPTDGNEANCQYEKKRKIRLEFDNRTPFKKSLLPGNFISQSGCDWLTELNWGTLVNHQTTHSAVLSSGQRENSCFASKHTSFSYNSQFLFSMTILRW